MTIKNFSEASRILNSFVPHPIDIGKSYNLDMVRKLGVLFDSPQDKIKIIHVAGTSGKTSTSYYVAALLHAAGKRVGLTVSPHITQVNERVQIDSVPMSEREFCQELEVYIEKVAASGLAPTYYELLMIFALYQFAKRKVDYAVVEVGLGGLLDGSNIAAQPDKICVITDIGFDHTHILGNTLAKIIAQKAGIIHEANEAFMYRQGEEVMSVVRDVARQNHAVLHELQAQPTMPSIEFLPKYQQRNILLARIVADFALERDYNEHITDEILLAAAQTNIPGRMEIFHKNGKTIVLDGAHNPQKLAAFTEAFRTKFGSKPAAVLIAFTVTREHALQDNLGQFHGIATSLIATTLPSTQDLPHESVGPGVIATEASHQFGESTFIAADPNLDTAWDLLLSRPEELCIVAGSFFLVSGIRAKLQS